MRQGSTGFRKGCSTRVPFHTGFHEEGFHEAEVRFHKAPQFHKGSINVLQRFHKGSTICCGGKQCVVRRLKSQRSSKLRAQEIVLLMGGTLSKTENVQDTAPKQ